MLEQDIVGRAGDKPLSLESNKDVHDALFTMLRCSVFC